MLDAWIAYHAGRFEEADALGLAAGGAGINAANKAANKAACIYGTYLEPDEKKKLAIFAEAAARAEKQQQADPGDANAFYLHAFALGRHAQGISIVKALKDGIGTKVKDSLDTAIRLAPKHADAHIALGAYHAEIIDSVGAMLGVSPTARKKKPAKNYSPRRSNSIPIRRLHASKWPMA